MRPTWTTRRLGARRGWRKRSDKPTAGTQYPPPRYQPARVGACPRLVRHQVAHTHTHIYPLRRRRAAKAFGRSDRAAGQGLIQAAEEERHEADRLNAGAAASIFRARCVGGAAATLQVWLRLFPPPLFSPWTPPAGMLPPGKGTLTTHGARGGWTSTGCT